MDLLLDVGGGGECAAVGWEEMLKLMGFGCRCGKWFAVGDM